MYDLNPVPKEPMFSPTIKIVLAAVCLAGIVLIAFALRGAMTGHPLTVSGLLGNGCPAQVKDYRKQIAPILNEWGDATALAAKSSRIAIAPQVANLQAIKRKMDAIEPASCVSAAHTALVTSMTEEISGFLSFMAQDSDDIVSSYMNRATIFANMANRELDAAEKP